MDTTTNQNATKLTAIEKALAAAKARKAALTASGNAAPPAAKPTTETKPPKAKAAKETSPEPKAEKTSKRKSATDERASAKAAKLAQLELERTARRAAREEKRAARNAEKAAAAASKKPSHMKKVERARSKCPAMGGDAEKLFNEITSNLSAQQIDAIAQHLLVHNRAMATIRATATPRLELGATVRITGGDPRFIGMVGEVVHSHKLRAKVQVPGRDKVVYIYNGEAVVVEASTAAA